jgi:signal transduction histidine kinase
VRLVPETASDGSIETLLAIMYDVTDRVLAERERQALLNMLTHDLKSPLTALTLHAQSLRQLIARQGVPEAEALSARLSRFEDIAVQIAGLVDELSDLARLEARNRIDLQLVPVDLIDLARTCIDEARHSGASPAIQLETELNDLTVEGDLTRLRRVIANLLDNAVKYSPAHADITVRVLLEDGVAVVRVRDRGIGIPAADLPHIFNFRRRAGNVGDIAGSGVGLNGALRIVEQHGGTITVESSEGQGSTFTVRLPIG